MAETTINIGNGVNKDADQNPKNNADETLNQPYTDKRTIIISLTHNYSAYRKANMQTLGQRKETIGSSFTSCRVLSSHKDEVEAYMPELLGISPNHPEFASRVRAWFSNIQFVVNENDYVLDVSFYYNTKADYLRFKKEEDIIDEEYSKVDRSNISAIKDAIAKRVSDLTELESKKCKYGKPVHIEQYLMYRHCLLYKDVAKDTALINSDQSYRFYIKDANKEAERVKKLTEEKKKAMRNFIELGASEQKFNAVYVNIVSLRNENVAIAMTKTKDEKEQYLMDYINQMPDKFNKVVTDKNVVTKAFIETLIVRGELIKSDFNQQIMTPDGSFIGSNMTEAVAFFNNPSNKEMRDTFETKLKMF